MSVPTAIEFALKRLAAAVDHLEAAAERREDVSAGRRDGDEEFAIMRDDRSRLAVELDGALVKIKRLGQANDEAMKRIDRASEAIQAALGDEAPEEEQGSSEPADDVEEA
jgi:hypothetical protein